MIVKRFLSMLVMIALTSAILIIPISTSAAGIGSTAGKVSTSSDSLFVRNSGSTSGVVLASLTKGSYVTLISKSGSWWKVEYEKGKYGYCYTSYIQPETNSFAAFVNLSTGNLNVRSGAGTSYAIQASLTKNTGIVVLSQNGGWSRILYNGIKTGYVNSTYISAYNNTYSYPAISLAVPNFKQTDNRWSSYPLGTTGKTIGTVGCLTTAISMIESYRTGTIIYPNVMATKLTYSADATLYWPTNIAFSTNADYLNTLYSFLKSGKSVLFGAIGSYGQHWVVVTGYTGGGSLTASGFTINDPGSSSRTNLQQLLNSYPTFYKIGYYQ